ncbi:MAG: tetratricopeptide repeat protein [Thermoplasmata archaeon]|nr:tetratricopeptide repeat protein [Thermoplasmata archaeon]
MAENRRLAAIMFTDTVGFTASVQADEALTLALLHEQSDLVGPILVTHQGQVIKSTGDGFLVEFESALKAIRCAIEVQRRIHDRNAGGDRVSFQIRIGIHLGDVERHAGDILGDAVNIAARVEPIAEPGGVCVSGAVRDQVWNKIPDRLEKLPPRVLKGLKEGTDLYRVLLPWSGPTAPLASPTTTGLAILPFANISPDPTDEYFADGLTEEVITVLSQLRSLRVIARTSVTPYKSTAKGIAQIGAELGVSSILEGSVRKDGNRLRVTFQLIDVRSQGHVWAQTYDRELDDIFAIQAELARRVMDVLKVELGAVDVARLEARPVVRPESYLAYLKGRTLLYHPSRPKLESAKEHFEKAISLDPRNGAAYSGLADVIRMMGWWTMEAVGNDWDETCRRLAMRAIELNPDLAEAHTSLALSHWSRYDFAGAETEFQRALSLNPSYSAGHHWYAELLENMGEVDTALVQWDLAEGTDPVSPFNLLHYVDMLIWMRKLDEAQVRLQKVAALAPEDLAYLGTLADYHLARSDPAQALKVIERAEELEPNPVRKVLWRLYSLSTSGERDQARALVEREEVAAELALSPANFGRTWADLGDLDQCFRWLDKAFDAHSLAVHIFRFEPRYEPVRKDPRFAALLTKMNLA